MTLPLEEIEARARATHDETVLALVARVRELEGLKRTCEDMLADFMTSEAHHPDHVLISAKTFEAIQAVLTINGDAPR